jgi:hypothetical protein
LLVAITTNESLVDVSPSTVTRLNEPSASSVANCFITPCETQASVAMNPSMVAMLGRIMPAPLLMPVMVTSTPSTLAFALKALATVSVVMMPSAARSQWSGRASASAAGRPASMRSTGSGSMITPVENGSTCSGAISSSRASAMQVERARTRPSSPVPALALPVLMTIARMSPLSKCSRHTCTGAAQKRLRVKTPATLAPGSINTTVRSLRLALRTPASATPMRTPATGNRSPAAGAGRFTGMGGVSVGCQPWRQGRPRSRQPPRLPRWPSASASPSKPSRML